MSETISERKEVSTVEKRARWEAMEFQLGASNTVHVENVGFRRVFGGPGPVVEDGQTVECTCPADQYMAKCKHRLAVENEPAVVEAGSASIEEMQEAR